MKKNLLIYLTFIGLTALFTSCEKDGEMIKMLSNPVVPTITTLPDLTLVRANGNQLVEFVGTPVDPGFQASAIYYLDACAAGTNFADFVTVLSASQPTSMKISISDLNGALLRKFPAETATSVDFRLRAELTVDAGTGAPGTGANPFSYVSPVKNASVTPYGLPRLNLIGSGLTQKIESALGDGNYMGFVNLDVAKPFTLVNPDNNISYGGTLKVLAVNGPALVAESNGWNKVTVSVPAMTYEVKPFAVGLIGSATPNAWSAPDSKMEFNPAGGFWHITLNLVVGEVKFRVNDKWDDGLNLGLGDASNPGYSLGNLWNNGGSKNIPIETAGNYTVKLYIGSTAYSCTITKN